VRSLFFRYGLHFADEGYGAVVFTDDTGAATVRIAMPTDMQSCLIFHYNLKFYDSDEELSYDGVSLKRFVMQSVIGNIVAFRVHAPCSGAFLLDIFANAVTPQEYLTGEPMKFKSVCKFKVRLNSVNLRDNSLTNSNTHNFNKTGPIFKRNVIVFMIWPLNSICI